MKNSLPKPPKGYTAEARRLWYQVLEGWDLDPPAVTILDSACRALVRAREGQQPIKEAGLVVKDRFGQDRAHPAVLIERDSAQALLATLKALNLDIEPLHDGPGRPPGR